MSTIPRPHLSSLWTAVLFTLYFFVFLTSEVFLQDCLLALDRPEDLHIFFLGQMACLAAGYLSLSLCRRCAYGLLRSVAAAAMLFPALLFIALAFMGIPASLLLWAAACSYFLGGTGAFLHYSAALCLHRSAVTGKVAGGSIGLAVAIQFLTDTCLDSGQTAILLALVSLVLAMLLARTPAPATADEAPSAPPSRRTLALVTAGTAILSIVVGLNEDIVTRLYATGALDVTSWPRLCYLAGLLLAGVCAIFFWSGQLRDHGAARSAPPLRQDQAIGLFAQKHALTHRETDVLRAVLASSDPLGNIAVCLGISERVMQRHLTSIYAKCGVSGRLELVTAFFGQTPP